MAGNTGNSVDHGTSAVERAGQLGRLWDGYLSHGDLDQVRLPIAESWERSHVAGVDPAVPRALTHWPDRHDVAARWQEHPLRTVLPTIHRWLARIAVQNRALIVVSDPYGVLLWVWGDHHVRSAAFDAMNFVEGALWSETSAGTNAVGTALAADHPVQVHGAEHYLQAVHGWTCSAAPVHDPETGHLLGILDLSGLAGTADVQSLPATLAAARAVEADLRVQAQIHDARMRVRYLDRLSRSRERFALVSSTGRVIADHPDGFLHASHVEIPSDGGIRSLPGGGEALAEPLAGTDAFILRPMPSVRQRAFGRDEEGFPSGQLDGWQQAQIELSRLADEQAALRRVATLVAGRATPHEIFSAVAEEVARVFHTDRSAVCRYEQDGTMTFVAQWPPDSTPAGRRTRINLDGDSVAALVQQSGQPRRIDSYENIAGSLLDHASRSLGTGPQSTVGAPILADGRVWGSVLAVSTVPDRPVAAGSESQLAAFAELIAMAISNAVALAALNASRARIVAAADNARRKIERDIHDGAQQRLISLALSLGSAVDDRSAPSDHLRQELQRAADAVDRALEDLRETSRGIHPAILSKRGLPAALGTLARRSAIPVDLKIQASRRLPERVEVTAYYVVSELITNTVKHARASAVRVSVTESRDWLQLVVSDDGCGGADAAGGSGLTGLGDRVDTIGGTIAITSPKGAGTVVEVSLPV